MRNIHIFNPQNDLALANGSANFTAPASAMNLAIAGACLPIWYGERGDCFIGAVNARWFDGMASSFNIDVSPVMEFCDGDTPRPWGWSAAIKTYLERFGFPAEVLPSDKKIDDWRTLSGRVFSSALLSEYIKEIYRNQDYGCLLPVIACSVEDAMAAISRFKTAMIKLPWSGSGRGQQVSDRTTPVELERRVAGMIKRQNAVEITPFYDKLLDFAMLWDKGEFTGYSLFTTDTHGGWTKNILLNDAEIEAVIENAVDDEVNFALMKEKMGEIIRKTCREFDFFGPVGVDFIVARGENGNFIVPVEINWRRTMGHLAHKLKSDFICRDSVGLYYVLPSDEVKSGQYDVKDCSVSNGRIERGKLDLVPPGGAFRFIVEISEQR